MLEVGGKRGSGGGAARGCERAAAKRHTLEEGERRFDATGKFGGSAYCATRTYYARFSPDRDDET